MTESVGAFLRMGSAEVAQALAAKAEAEKKLAEAERKFAEAVAASSAADQKFASYRAAADEKVGHLTKKIAGLTADRDAARSELHQARLGQGPAYVAFLERVVCSTLFPDLASNIANCLGLLAIDAVLDDVVKDFPTLEKGKYADPPLGDDEVLAAITSAVSGWLRRSPVLKAVMSSPELLSEEQIRELCPEDRDGELVRLLAEANSRPLDMPEERVEGSGQAGDPNSNDPLQPETHVQPGPSAGAVPLLTSEACQTADVPPQTEVRGDPPSGNVEQNVD